MIAWPIKFKLFPKIVNDEFVEELKTDRVDVVGMESAIILEKAGLAVKPYYRLKKRMDRYLLLQEVAFVNKSLNNFLQKGMLLDFCCGVGEVSSMLQIESFQSLGYDINRLALIEFKKNRQDMTLIQGDATHLPLKDESFDGIVALHCFDLIDRLKFFEECSHLLHHGGVLIFDALNRNSYKLILKSLGRMISPPDVNRVDSKWIDVSSTQEVMEQLNKFGFDLLAAKGYGWPPFRVNSDSSLVNYFAKAEQFFGLNRMLYISPRILVAARKNGL